MIGDFIFLLKMRHLEVFSPKKQTEKFQKTLLWEKSLNKIKKYRSLLICLHLKSQTLFLMAIAGCYHLLQRESPAQSEITLFNIDLQLGLSVLLVVIGAVISFA